MSQRAARSIGIRVAVLSAIMVLAGAIALFSYLWVDARTDRPHGPPERHGPGRPGDGEHRPGSGARVERDAADLFDDPGDIVEAVVVVLLVVVLLAGGGAMLFARQAVKPLEESMRRQRNFIGDASHELRTPLAVLDARIQQLQLMAGDDAVLTPVIGELRNDARVMTDILNDLLASVSESADDFDPVDVRTLIEQVVGEMSVYASDAGVGVRVESGSGARKSLVAVPETSLRRSLLALVDNAIGHTGRGRSVTVQHRSEPRWEVVRVIDEGHGITGIAPDRVFERFASGTGPAAPGEAPRQSHGIGLALVHDVVTRYGGTVDVESTGPDGTVFLLRLPAAGGGRS